MFIKSSDEIGYYLGIDGGGTKTEFVFATRDGRILSHLILPASNPNDVGFDETMRVLTDGILESCKGIPLSEVSAFAGLAGCSSLENLPKITDFMKSFGFGCVRNHNDAHNAVAASLGDGDGIMVIMGTGSIVYAKNGDELFRLGGYGYLFGDEGSGFAIGRDCILSSLFYEDGSGEYTALYDMTKSLCGGETVLSKIDMFYNEGKKGIARYAPLVFDAYEMGDKIAIDIIRKNLSSIGKLIKGGSSKIKSNKIKVSLCGGLTKRHKIIIPELLKYLSQDGREYDIFASSAPPVYGALRLAGLKCDIAE